MYGMDLNILSKSRTKHGLLWFIRKIIVLFHVYSCVVFAFSLYRTQCQNVEFENLKRRAARNFLFLSVVILWHIMNRPAKNLCYIFEFVKKQYIDSHVANAFCINAFSVMWPLVAQIISFKYSSSCISFNDMYYFSLIDTSTCNCFLMHYAIVFTYVALYETFVNCVVILYAVACNQFQKVILKYRDTNTELISFSSN